MKSLLKPHFFLWNQLSPCILESAKGFSLATIHSWISSAYATLFSEWISAMATRLGRFSFLIHAHAILESVKKLRVKPSGPRL
jgi:hypothetical protein